MLARQRLGLLHQLRAQALAAQFFRHEQKLDEQPAGGEAQEVQPDGRPPGLRRGLPDRPDADVVDAGVLGGLDLLGGMGREPDDRVGPDDLASFGDADVVLLYYARRLVDFAFANDLTDLAARHPGFRVAFLAQTPIDGGTPAGRFSAAHLATWAPDHAARETLLCGPAGLTRAVTRHWAEAGLSHRLRREAFVPAPNDDQSDRAAASISFRRSARTVESTAPTLLAIAEGAGIRPPTGCRMGICRTCTCTKVSGTVRDRVTGALDSAAGSRIRICVSEPLGPVTLDL